MEKTERELFDVFPFWCYTLTSFQVGTDLVRVSEPFFLRVFSGVRNF